MRSYKPKRKGSRQGRMLLAVQMRAQGMSLRKIAAELGVAHDTVRRDLQRAAVRQADHSASVIPLRRPA